MLCVWFVRSRVDFIEAGGRRKCIECIVHKSSIKRSWQIWFLISLSLSFFESPIRRSLSAAWRVIHTTEESSVLSVFSNPSSQAGSAKQANESSLQNRTKNISNDAIEHFPTKENDDRFLTHLFLFLQFHSRASWKSDLWRGQRMMMESEFELH